MHYACTAVCAFPWHTSCSPSHANLNSERFTINIIFLIVMFVVLTFETLPIRLCSDIFC